MPARRYPDALAAGVEPDVPTNAASEPKSRTSTSGHSDTSNRRCGLRTSTYACRRAIARMRNHDLPRVVSGFGAVTAVFVMRIWSWVIALLRAGRFVPLGE